MDELNTDTFLTGIVVNKIRHLKNITIPLSATLRTHLLLTGRNGSGKTGVLKHLALCLDRLVSADAAGGAGEGSDDKSMAGAEGGSRGVEVGVEVQCNGQELRRKYQSGELILAYFGAERQAKVEVSDTIERITLQDRYKITDNPGTLLAQYMVMLKTIQAFAGQKQDLNKVAEIEAWFQRFEEALRLVLDEPSLVLDFDLETFRFSLVINGRERCDLNQLSGGYAAILAIINDLTMRCAQKDCPLEGIVIIDEIESHLHPKLQQKILPALTTLYPKVQFVVSTNSPFVLCSLVNVVVCDLDQGVRLSEGLHQLSYEDIVKSYFQVVL